MSGKNKSPAGAILALLILVIIVVALIFILRGGGNGNTEPSADPDITVSEPPADADDSGDGDVSVPTPPVQETTEPTASPTPTPIPTPTPAPTPTPTPAVNASSGSFRSDTGTGLNIVVDWTLTPGANGATLSFKVSTESYSLYNNEAWHGLSVTIGGQTWEFDTKAIEYEGPGLGTNELAEGSVELSTSSIPATATVNWHFQGSYGGTDLESVTATGTIS